MVSGFIAKNENKWVKFPEIILSVRQNACVKILSTYVTATQCGNYENSLSHFFTKISKSTFSRNKLLKI